MMNQPDGLQWIKASDADVLIVDEDQNLLEYLSGVFQANGFDTLTAINGTLNLSGTKGLSFTPPADGTADATMTFTGTIADINAALDGLTYKGNQDFNGPDTLTIMTDDLGMKALSGSLATLTRQALGAGCDVILSCNSPLEDRRAVAEASSR